MLGTEPDNSTMYDGEDCVMMEGTDWAAPEGWSDVPCRFNDVNQVKAALCRKRKYSTNCNALKTLLFDKTDKTKRM